MSSPTLVSQNGHISFYFNLSLRLELSRPEKNIRLSPGLVALVKICFQTNQRVTQQARNFEIRLNPTVKSG